MEVSGKLHTPAALSPGKEPLVPLDKGLGETQSHSGRGGEEKNSHIEKKLLLFLFIIFSWQIVHSFFRKVREVTSDFWMIIYQ